MDCNFTSIPYKQTGYFSPIIIDYLEHSPKLQPFYQYPVSVKGLEAAISARQSFNSNRKLLVDELKKQYGSVPVSKAVKQNIDWLLQKNTFTVCTAHQPAIFTGALYFIYKILHTIKLSVHLNKELPQYKFVPVYWMGSEDADLEELGKIYLDHEKIVWNTKQTGSVGRMNTKGLETIINRINGELSVLPHGKELLPLLKESYLNSPDIQTATFKLLNALFAEYGLVTIIADTPGLKGLMQPLFEDELFNQTASSIVEKTIEQLSRNYKVQANPRAINLFYLKDNIRELIEARGTKWEVRNTSISFSKNELRSELQQHPERFSPNVILRGLYQETVLPNIAFVGGGGELAYWLEFKDLFGHYKVPYPVLVLRNSFLIVEKKWHDKIHKLGLDVVDFFKSEQELLSIIVNRHKNGQLKLENELQAVSNLYHHLKDKAAVVDKSLLQHVEALEAKALRPLQELEKKLLRAEKRKYETEQRQIHAIKSALFPLSDLQERIENFLPYYAKWGQGFMDMLYRNSLVLPEEFGIVTEK